MLDRIEPQLAQYGGLTRAILLDLVDAARARGWANITNYAVAGVTSLGVPIRDRGGQLVGALSVSAITARMQPREEFVVQTMLREVAGLQKGL